MKRVILVLTIIGILLPLMILLEADICLWEVENGRNKVYLLGSIHIMPETAYPLDENYEKAFKEADILVVEVDPENLDQKELNNLVVRTAFYPEGESLEDNLTPELYSDVVEKFSLIDIGPEKLNYFRPWFAGLNLNMTALQKLKIEEGLGIDKHFLAQAREQETPILELETATTQLEALSSMPDSLQSAFLAKSIKDFDKVEEHFSKMLEAWQAGDAAELDELSRKKILEEAGDQPGVMQYYNKVFPEREVGMLEKIYTYLENEEEHTYFVIVGVFHLVGDDGMLQVLEDKGYKTKQY